MNIATTELHMTCCRHSEVNAVNRFIEEVKAGVYPDDEHSYH